MSDNTSQEVREEILALLQLRYKNGVLEQQLLVKEELIENGQVVLSDTSKLWRPVERIGVLKAKDIDWASVDWNKSSSVLARELNLPMQVVSSHRGRYGHKALPNPHSKIGAKVVWADVDWNKTNTQISRELGVNPRTIAQARASIGDVNPAPRAARADHIDDDLIHAVDWEWTRDSDAGKQLQVSRERARQIRAQYGKPFCKFHKMSTRQIAAMKWLIEHRQEVEGKFSTDVMRMIPSNLQASGLRKVLRVSGIKFERKFGAQRDPAKVFTRGKVALMNFELPNVVLAIVWKCGAHTPANFRTLGLQKPAKWWAGGAFNSIHKDPEILAAIKAEIEKAKANGIDVNERAVQDWLDSKVRLNEKGEVAATESRHLRSLRCQKKAEERKEEIQRLEQELSTDKLSS